MRKERKGESMMTKEQAEKCAGCKEALSAFIYFSRKKMRHKIICDDCSRVWGSEKVKW